MAHALLLVDRGEAVQCSLPQLSLHERPAQFDKHILMRHYVQRQNLGYVGLYRVSALAVLSTDG